VANSAKTPCTPAFPFAVVAGRNTYRQQRVTRLQDMTARAEDNQTFLSTLCFSDEATFRLSGKENRQLQNVWQELHRNTWSARLTFISTLKTGSVAVLESVCDVFVFNISFAINVYNRSHHCHSRCIKTDLKVSRRDSVVCAHLAQNRVHWVPCQYGNELPTSIRSGKYSDHLTVSSTSSSMEMVRYSWRT
jgi:hypothetical protein